VWQVDVIKPTRGLRGRVVARQYFALDQQAIDYAHQFIGNYRVQIYDRGYVPDHPVEQAHDDYLAIEHYKSIVRDYFGDDVVTDRNWERYATKMEKMEESKRRLRQTQEGVPF